MIILLDCGSRILSYRDRLAGDFRLTLNDRVGAWLHLRGVGSVTEKLHSGLCDTVADWTLCPQRPVRGAAITRDHAKLEFVDLKRTIVIND